MNAATFLFTLLIASPNAQTGLSKAGSFQAEETLGKAHITVKVIRPDKVSVVLSNNNGRDGMYLFDGKSAYEYHKWSNSFEKLDPQPDGRILCPLLDLGAVDILLNGGAFGPAQPGVKRTVTQDSLNGVKAVLTTDLFEAKTGRDGKTYQSENQLWTDASTGMPLRRTEGVISDGAPHVFQDLTFEKIQLDPDLEIAWKAPAGSTEGDPGNLLKPGALAPDFAAIGPDGRTVHLSDFRGKVVVLDFWATWCGPCQRAMPHLQHVYEQIKDRSDLAVLGVCVWDEKNAYRQWVQQKKGTYTFQTAFDPAGRGKGSIASKLFQVEGIPTQYVIGKDGKVAAAYIAVESKARPLETTLAKLGITVGP